MVGRRRTMRWPFRRLLVLFLLASLVGGAVALAQGSAFADVVSGSWIDAHPGDAVPDVRARLGDPLRRVLAEDVYASRYTIAKLTAYAVLYEKSGRVVEIRVFSRGSGDPAPSVTDPYHVSLGSSYDSLKTTRGTPTYNATQQHDYVAGYQNSDGTRSLYEFSNEKVVAIEMLVTLESLAPLPSPAPFSEHTGDSIAQAIVDIQATDQVATDWEYLYLAHHPCADDTQWKVQKQALINNAKRAYDVLDVTCPANGDHRQFFFDITATFAKT